MRNLFFTLVRAHSASTKLYVKLQVGLYGRQLFGVKAGAFFTACTECYHQNRKSFWMVDLAVELCSVIVKCFHIKTNSQ